MQQGTTTPERMIGVGALASLTAGLVAGIGARIIMRIVALTSHMPPQFSVGGTLNIIIPGMFIGLFVGFTITILTFVLSVSPKTKKYVPGPIWRGLIVGIVLLLIFGLPLFLSSSFPNIDINFGIPLLNKNMFGALIIMYGITLGVAEKILDRYLPGKAVSTKTEAPGPQPHEE